MVSKAARLAIIAVPLVLAAAVTFWATSMLQPQRKMRDPQSESPGFDYSQLSGSDLQLASVERLISGAELRIDSQQGLGFSLGNFLLPGADGAAAAACDIYSMIEIVFLAGDMAVSGEPPTMIVSGPCRTSSNPDFIEPLYVLKDQILSLPVGELTANSVTNPAVGIQISQVSDSWPLLWIVHSIRLSNDAGQELFISEDEIRHARTSGLSLEW